MSKYVELTLVRTGLAATFNTDNIISVYPSSTDNGTGIPTEPPTPLTNIVDVSGNVWIVTEEYDIVKDRLNDLE